jgi:F-type H+/Na+-transporting ATPase subunit alpha
MALNLEEQVLVSLFLVVVKIFVKALSVKRLGRLLRVPVGDALLGRVVNALGRAIDGKGPINATETRFVEEKAPGIMARKSVHEPLQLVLKQLMHLFQLVVVKVNLSLVIDKQVKLQLLLILLSIKKVMMLFVYVAIGQKESTVAQVVKKLEEHGAMDYTIIVSAPASEAAAMQFLAPYTGVSMGEYFRDSGRHGLIVYDDLSKHAVAYREMSLILRSPPGREAYPGDVFYLHSRLVRACSKS